MMLVVAVCYVYQVLAVIFGNKCIFSLYCFKTKMPKGPVIQGMSILGKGENLSMEVLS